MKTRARRFFHRRLDGLPQRRSPAATEPVHSTIVPAGYRMVAGEAQGDVTDAPFALTTSQGLLVWNGQHFDHLTRRPAYGLTVRDGVLWIFHRIGRHGQVVTVHRHQEHVEVVPRVWGLPGGEHHIDFVDDELLVTDPVNGRILGYRLDDGIPAVHATRAVRSLGLGERAPRAPVRIGALFRHDQLLLVLADSGQGPGARQSEIWAFDSASRLVAVVPAGGSQCHNLFFDGEQFVLCRSPERIVARGRQPVYRTDGFPRGLAVGEDRVLVGASALPHALPGRGNGVAHVDVLDRDFVRWGRISLRHGQIQNIRLLSGDLALSNAGRATAQASAPPRIRHPGRPPNLAAIPAPPTGREA
ncbi:hypothetical protein MMF93_00330 [Streptomyces tubbatahanensis]|uniref:Uncharacterized protein n=1 Tax=Streptomyces tubbatahanensis TaxID=2923272 RepID=A0ABY3XKZ7_9ACTN|nr:hypothetical protein [Streptomyces tubbatahanensis]UNS95079.1 hypothetical protein MMF93_00330 [Streptomyces tubbatahanensis]